MPYDTMVMIHLLNSEVLERGVENGWLPYLVWKCLIGLHISVYLTQQWQTEKHFVV